MSGVDFLYLCVVVWAGVMCMLALVLPARAPRERSVTVVAAPEAASAPAEPDTSHEDKETRHWCAQGLNKLGYTKGEAQRMADQVPAGYSLQQAIEFCLYKRGAKR